MTRGSVYQDMPALRAQFVGLETLFPAEPKVEKDLTLCFVCLRWTTGDEVCRRGDRCELERAIEGAATS